MEDRIRSALAELNSAFYARFADDFARTRRGWPPGFERILPYLRPAANVLDVGCGNGRLLAFLAERGWRGQYLGLDNSAKLLSVACGNIDAERGQTHASFVQADLLDRDWPLRVGAFAPDVIVSLAVLHHIPGAAGRARLVKECAELLPSAGILILSSWQFLSAPRLQARILPWTTIGLTDEDMEREDHLVAWGAGAAGRRYCAAIDRDALCNLAAKAGFSPVETFYADGHEGNLNLYGVFQLSAR
jgi:SAM-dependent methyltransferase